MSTVIKKIDDKGLAATCDVNGKSLALTIDSDNKVSAIGGRSIAGTGGQGAEYTGTAPIIVDNTNHTISADTVEVDLDTFATKTELAAKQDVLTAGTNITIQNNVISAAGGGAEYTVAESTWTSGPDTLSTSTLSIDNDEETISVQTQQVLAPTASITFGNTAYFGGMDVAHTSISASEIKMPQLAAPQGYGIATSVTAGTVETTSPSGGYAKLYVNDVVVKENSSADEISLRGLASSKQDTLTFTYVEL